MGKKHEKFMRRSSLFVNFMFETTLKVNSFADVFNHFA